jgi:hypothetical protein
LQAQVLEAAALGLRARSERLQRTDVMKALNEDRSIVRTWLMRGTLHLIASDDLGWMLGILGPVFAAGNKARHAQLGLDATTKSRGIEAIRQILSKEAPLTRHEIVDRLRRHGIKLDPKTQAPIHLIAVAALNGVLCLGPDRENGESTYVLIEDWIGTQRALSEESALRELAQRYFSAYGPASLDDFVSWSGLPVPRARSALNAAQPSLVEISIAGRSNFLPKAGLRRLPAAKPPSVRLLPAFDTYLLGYRSRELAVPPTLEKRLQRGGGWLHPAVVADGRAVGAWSIRRAGRRVQIAIVDLERVNAGIRKSIEAEIDDIGRFLGSSPDAP